MKKHINNEAEPLVSIITPCYNAARFLRETLESVQEQSYKNWEHILVDDASTDTSLEIAQHLETVDTRLKVIPLGKNMGAANARNLATKKAQGSFIAFLDADDLWHPEKLKRQIQFMIAHQCAVSFTSYVQIDSKGDEIGKRILAMQELTYKKQHVNNYIGNLTGIYNTNHIGKISAPNIRKRQDWAMWTEAIKRSKKPALGIQEDLAYYRIRQDSMSAAKSKLVKYNFLFYKDYLNYSILKSVYYILRFFWEYFVVRPIYIKKYEVTK